MSWQSGSQQVAVIFASVIGLILSSALRPEQMAGWGWRVPLLIGSMLIPLTLLFLRRWWRCRCLKDRRFSRAQASSRMRAKSGGRWRPTWRLVILGMMLATMTTVTFYLITAYMPTFPEAA